VTTARYHNGRFKTQPGLTMKRLECGAVELVIWQPDGTHQDDAIAPWLPETTRPPLCKFWTAGVPNILVTRPQGRPLTDEEKAMIGKYDAVVTDIEGAVAAMETALGQRVYTSLNLVVADALQLATQILGSAKETP